MAKAKEKKTVKMNINAGLDFLIKKTEKNAKHSSRIFRAADAPSTWRYVDFIDVTTGTACLPLEYFFGTRGLLCGRVVKFDALEATGKSSLMYMFYGMGQRTGGIWANHNETESAVTPPDFIASLGCNPKNLIIEKPGSVDKCLDGAEEFVRNIRNEVDTELEYPIVVGIDSVSSLGSGAMDLDTGDVDGDKSKAKHARAFSEFFREKLEYFDYNQTVIMASAQLKAYISMGPMSGDNPNKKTTSIAEGAFKYHASWILNMKHFKLEENGSDVGERIMAKMEKNKLAPKGREMEFHLYRDGRGWDFTKANINLLFGTYSPLATLGITHKAGGGYYYCDLIGGGKGRRAKEFVEEFYQVPGLLDQCREALKIRGFGFDFENKYMAEFNTDAGD